MKLLYTSSSPEDLKFINKFSEVFSSITCVHSTLFSYFYHGLLEFENIENIIGFKKNCNHGYDIKYEFAQFNLVNRLLDRDEIANNYCGFEQTFSRVIKKNNYDLVMIPSGRMLSQKILSEICKNNSIPTIFIGYGNFPGKTFLDPLGTDFASSLRDLYIPEYAEDAKGDWGDKYLQMKMRSPKPPQAKKIWKTKSKRVLRFLLCKLEKLLFIAHDTNYKSSDVLRFIFNVAKRNDTSEVDLENMDYIFYPCQLSTDAQLILNSDIDNLSAIQIAAKQSNKLGKELIVKLHPAETDSVHLKKIYELQKLLKFKISGQNTYEILKNCASIVTINSTMGIEAIAIGKKTEVLGRAVYKCWNARQAINYFENILFDIDYFSEEKISMHEWVKIKSRFNL